VSQARIEGLLDLLLFASFSLEADEEYSFKDFTGGNTMNRILILFLIVFAAGCSVKAVDTKYDSIAHKNVEGHIAVYFVSDNQFHITDGRAYPIENYLSDKSSGVAVRPPQTTVLAPLAFEALLSGLDQSALLIHLGDACDVSCPQELDRFFEAMDHYRGPWIFVPGNHDGFYTGNSQYRSDNIGEWDYACGGKRLDKADAISTYLARKFGRAINREDDICEVRGDWREGEANGSYIAIIYNNPDLAHRSFIVQQVRFKAGDGKNIRIIVLDTSQYKNPPKYRNVSLLWGYKLAGTTGELLDDQLKVVEEWLSDSLENQDILFIAGHHPLKSKLSSTNGVAWFGGSSWLKEAMSTYHAEGYISAHTHSGGTRRLWSTEKEWNTSSLVDWPLGMRVMRLKNGGYDIEEILFDRDELPDGICGRCGDHIDWKSNKEDFYFYTNYRDKKGTGPTGRYMHHYFLIAELEVIIETIREIDTKGICASLINKEETFLKEVKLKFDSRYEVSSEIEIEKIRPHITESLRVLEDFVKQHSNSPKSNMIKEYIWCQLWWAAKEDAQSQWRQDDVTGKRKSLGGDWDSYSDE
jgi:3',5'-cyclic AMP phosphodiesterase CpdA